MSTLAPKLSDNHTAPILEMWISLRIFSRLGIQHCTSYELEGCIDSVQLSDESLSGFLRLRAYPPDTCIRDLRMAVLLGVL